MKKNVLLFITFMFLFSVSAHAVTVEFIIGDATIAKVNNETENRELETSPLLAAPYIANDRTMVPIRALSESFNCKVGWDPALREVKIVNSDREIKLYIDSTKAYVNDIEIVLDACPEIRGDITFVPVRFVTENMGYNVAFIPEAKSVLIYDKQDISANGFSAIYPAYDVFNYVIYLTTGLYPNDETDKDGLIRNNIKNAMLCYSYLQNIVDENNLSISDDYFPSSENYEDCYKANVLKGEYAKNLKNYGLEDAVKSYFAEKYQDEALKVYSKEYVCAKHILISSNEISDSDAKKTADKIYNLAKNGGNFDILIEQYGEDPGMKTSPDGYVFTTGEMVEEFEKTAFDLNEGEISKPVKTQFGYHIIMRMPLPKISYEITKSITDDLYFRPIMESFGLK